MREGASPACQSKPRSDVVSDHLLRSFLLLHPTLLRSHSPSSAAIIIIFGILTILSACLLVYGVKLIVRECKSKRGWKWDSSKITAFWCVVGSVGVVFTTAGWWLATVGGSRLYYYGMYQIFGLPLVIAALVFAVNTNGLMWIQIAKGAKKLSKGGANLQKKVRLRVRPCSNVFS